MVAFSTRRKTESTCSARIHGFLAPCAVNAKKNPGHLPWPGLRFIKSLGRCLHPFEGALPVKPNVPYDQNAQKNEHACQGIDLRQAKALLASRKQHGPGKEKRRLHIEDYKENRNDV